MNITTTLSNYQGTVAVITEQPIYGIHTKRFLPKKGYLVEVIPLNEKDAYLSTQGIDKKRPDFILVDSPDIAEEVKKIYQSEIEHTKAPKIIAISSDHYSTWVNPAFENTTVVKPTSNLKQEILEGIIKARKGDTYKRRVA